MTEPFKPQFNTQKLDLLLKKGETARFNLTVTGSYGMNFANALVFGEVRRKSPGFSLVKRFTASTTINTPNVQIKAYPATADKSKILSLLPVRVGDKVIVEGAVAIAKVDAVTDSTLVLNSNATKTVSEARIFNRSASVAAFHANVASSFTVNVTSNTSNTLNVTGVTQQIPAGSILAFTNGTGVTGVTVASTVNAGQTSIGIRETITAGTLNNYNCYVTNTVGYLNNGSADITINANNTTGVDVSIQGWYLGLPAMTANTRLYVQSYSNVDKEWKYVGAVAFKENFAGIPPNFVGIPPTALTTPTVKLLAPEGNVIIPPFSKFMVGVIPFNTISLELYVNSAEFYDMDGEYGYEILVRLNNGDTVRVMEGNCTFTDSWSDLQ
jgi:hypothetical protein